MGLKIVFLILSFIWIEYLLYKGIFIVDKKLANGESGAEGEYFLGNLLIGIPVIIFVFTLSSIISSGITALYITLGLFIVSGLIMFFISLRQSRNKGRK